MPRCPSCGKGGFATHDTISRHMSQLRSGCSTWFNNLVRIHEDLGRDDNGPNYLRAVDLQPENIDKYNVRGNNDEEMHDGTQEDDSEPIEYFLGAAKAFSGGPTFLNKFEVDQFNECRSSNIYYPFASRGEWQMGSWLLHSGLSMSAINAFLSLDLVYPLLTRHGHHAYKSFRSKHYPYPSIQQLSFESELSYCPVDHAGSPRRSPCLIQQRDPSSTGGTPLSFYSIYSTTLNFRTRLS